MYLVLVRMLTTTYIHVVLEDSANGGFLELGPIFHLILTFITILTIVTILRMAAKNKKNRI